MYKTLFAGARFAACTYLAIFLVWSLSLLLKSTEVTRAVLQLAFILGLFLWRRNRREALFCIPDEMLVCLPYFWGLANVGSAHVWAGTWIPWLAAVSVFSLPAVFFCGAFSGGFRKNALLVSAVAATLFVLVFSTLMKRFYPLFPMELYQNTVYNLVVAVAGIPVSIAAFYGCRLLLPLSSSDRA